MIIHGFSKNNQLAEQLIAAGFYLSFGKYLLKNPDLKTVFQNIPNDRFFLETDTIEESIQQVYELASEYKGLNLKELQDVILSNYRKLFRQ
jgi:TatD DNase family protein